MTESEKIQYEELMATPIKELRRLAEKKGFDAHIFVEKSEIAKAIIRGTIL